MRPLVLTLRTDPDERLDLSALVPHRLSGKTATEIGKAFRESIGFYDIAMTAVEVTALIEDRAKVEIEVTAVVPD